MKTSSSRPMVAACVTALLVVILLLSSSEAFTSRIHTNHGRTSVAVGVKSSETVATPTSSSSSSSSRAEKERPMAPTRRRAAPLATMPAVELRSVEDFVNFVEDAPEDELRIVK